MQGFIKKIIPVKIVLLLIMLECLPVSYAQSGNTALSGGFSISAVIPENQIDKKQTYFDLKMKPGDKQTVEVIVMNAQDDEISVQIGLNPASTGRNGLIIYTEPGVRDELMELSILDVAEIETDRLTIPAHSSKRVKINIIMPQKSFEGVLLGGITVTGNESEGITEQGSVTLKNKITYVLALKLTENETEVTPDFDLFSVSPELINYKTAISAVLHNKAARIVKGMDVKAQIFLKDSDTVIRELICTDAEMAPLSKGSFIIDWQNEPIKQGIYGLLMTADYEGKTWSWEKELIIGGEANDINNEAVGLRKDYTWLYIVIGAAAFVLVWLIAYRLGKGKKNRREQMSGEF